MRNSIFLAAIFLLFGLTADAQDYIRFRQGPTERDGALQIAVETWTTPSGVTVDLYGVVHMADEVYYQTIQRDLDRYDSVLYEGIKQGATPNKETKVLNTFQNGMAKLMGLQFQKDGISYVGTNMVHADIDATTLEQKLDGEKLTPFGGLVSPEQLKSLEPLIKIAGQLLDAYVQSNPGFQDGIKLQFAQQMVNTDIEKQLPPKMRQAIIVDRNQIVMDELAKRLKAGKDKRIAIFYGAGHNPDFARRFTALGYTRGAKRWLSAWNIGRGPNARGWPRALPREKSGSRSW